MKAAVAVAVALVFSHALAWEYGRDYEARYALETAQALHDVRYLRGIVTGQLARSAGISEQAVRECILADRRLLDSLAVFVEVE